MLIPSWINHLGGIAAVEIPRGIGGARLPSIVLPRLALPSRGSLKAAALAVGLTAFTSLLVVAGGPALRLGVAFAATVLLVTLTLIRPSLGVVATLVYLVFLATLRRVLLPVAPWMAGDPLLLVAPFIATLLIVKALVLDSRRVAPDVISKLVVVVLAITVAQVANPQGGGIAAGISGLMFMAVPLLWFFVGREFIRSTDIDRLLAVVVALGTVVACYGLGQNLLGHPSWDVEWLHLPGVVNYSSLAVEDETRAFATFASFGEYGLFLGSALVAAVALCMKGRLVAALPIPLLAVALFLSSGRQPLILASLAIVVMIGMRTGRPRTALLVTVVAGTITFAAVYLGSSFLSSAGSSSSSALVSHQLGGIANPLDPESSTLLIHLELAIAGVKAGVTHPLGQGTAVTNGAAGLVEDALTRDVGLDAENTLGEGSSGTDVDISNAFVAFGVVGGAIYALLILVVGVRAVGGFFGGRPELLPIVGILVVNLGQWANGGNYALASLIWLLIGVVAATRPSGDVTPLAVR